VAGFLISTCVPRIIVLELSCGKSVELYVDSCFIVYIYVAMSNQELVDAGMKRMDETDQAIERSKQVVHQTLEVGTQTASNLKGQTDQMGRVVNDLDTIQFSLKKASQLVKEIGRQVCMISHRT
jgi:septal ring factor EnvC (AmiA/AmiB activator)